MQGEECSVLLCSSEALLSSSHAAEGRIKVRLPKLRNQTTSFISASTLGKPAELYLGAPYLFMFEP